MGAERDDGGRGGAGHESDYEVGYGRPPVATRFRPGQSGNPGGRPRRRKGSAMLLREALDLPIVLDEGGVPVAVTRREAMFRTLVDRAVAGNPHALRQVLRLIDKHEPPDDIPTCITVEYVSAKPYNDDEPPDPPPADESP